MKFIRVLCALLALLVSIPAAARPYLIISSNESAALTKAKAHLAVKGWSPSWIVGPIVWLRADKGITSGIGAVTATGTTPPTVTLSGTPTALQTSGTTPYVEIDCTTLGAVGTSKFTFKVNGVTTATGVTSSTSPVAITSSGILAAWAVGASTINDVYTANIVVTTWADQSPKGHSPTQATIANRPTLVGINSSYGGAPTLYFSGSPVTLSGTMATTAQPITVYVVGEGGGGTSQKQFWSTGLANTTCPYWQQSGTHAWSMYAGALEVATTNTTTSAQAFACVFNGASSSVYINNSTTNVLAATNPGTSGLQSTALVIGSAASSNYLTGEIAEIYMDTNSDDPYTRGRMLTYFANRYAGSWQ